MAKKIEYYFDRLWPICRSITGPGFVQSLDILSEIMPMHRMEFKTGEKVLDWTVPEEWIPRDAYLVDPSGKKRAEFRKNNLHLVNYSIPYRGKLPLSELRKHIYTLPNQPHAVPYITSYYERCWGFCMTYNEFITLPEGEYEVVVDTEIIDGKLIIGESFLPGTSKKEVLFSSYLCHPSLAHNELSGPLVISFLYDELSRKQNRRYTYRFVLVPETIGAIAFLSRRGEHLRSQLIAGYQVTCVGNSGKFTYKRSRQFDSLADRAATCIMREMNNQNIIAFNPAVGSDERQYCSPGFNLAVGSLMRTMYTLYPEYHTSLDNKDLISFEGMLQVVDKYMELVYYIEENWRYLNKFPFGEPQLGARGLFRALSDKNRDEDELAMWWLLNYADGGHDLLTIAEISEHRMKTLIGVARLLEEAGIIEKIPDYEINEHDSPTSQPS